MTKDPHFTALENLYLAAPITQIYHPTIEILDSEATIEIEVKEELFHSAGALHGSVYFKLLDDSAFFAANSLERDVFVLTTSFTTYLTRPVSSGSIRAVGRVVNRNKSQFVSESVLHDSEGKEIGRGSGIFVRSKLLLKEQRGYSAEG
jgi:uncharacterized protein (TIGR00369 family)